MRPGRVRILALLAAAGFLAVALLVRQFTGDGHGGGVWAQASGTALYASMVYASVLFVRPRTTPLPAALVATLWSWGTEVAQLTGVPAALSERSLLARLVFGIQFDWADMFWYPVGVIPLAALHVRFRANRARRDVAASATALTSGADGQ